MATHPKAVLYYSPRSIWSCAVLLALEEKGYSEEELDFKIVDIASGENFAPTFLRLNSRATVPTLIVPLQETLADEVRFQPLVDTKSIIDFLQKSRSPLSKTNTVSQAPAPTLAPATVAFSVKCQDIIDILHSEDANPNQLTFFNARDDSTLKKLAAQFLPMLNSRQRRLAQLLQQSEDGSIQVSQKVKEFWSGKKQSTDHLVQVFTNDQAVEARSDYFNKTKELWEVKLWAVLSRLNTEIIGPYCLGEHISVADIHLSAWLTRIVMLSNGSALDNGALAIRKVEQHVGNEFVLPRSESEGDVVGSKLSAFWDQMKERSSWKKIYGDSLH